ncbi:hypothetical protein [Gordonia sp. (in: high G+C Gram-positive bacteria)]|uniref:hypothetical protein n=1 Tax=Gordonia sp. (in: high G+C Gram-positive bacteria) TaxID=84139 RepID=UPI002615720D|nr:hypothetical protein [Gordonia sp. (in: high G+C Gram-positive bacteria)]
MERSLHAQIAAHESWAGTRDRSARTAPARKAALDRFEKQVDPEGNLTPAERAKRAEHARKAYFKRLALKSAQARRKSREFADSARAAERELAQSAHADLDPPGHKPAPVFGGTTTGRQALTDHRSEQIGGDV